MGNEMTTTPAGEFDPAKLEVTSDAAALQTLMGGHQAICFASIPDVTPEDRELLYRAQHGSVYDLSKYLDKEIVVRGFLVHWASKMNPKTGELDEFPRIVLIGANGDCYESYSIGVRNCVRDLYIRFPPHPWDPPIRLRLYGIKTGQPCPLEKLDYVGRAPAAPAKGGDPDGPKTKR